MKRFFTLHWLLPVSFLIGLYFLTHLPGLTTLPVFADEAIYIRWSQLIIDDANRYLFLPLNDGKTPLWFWSMLPLLHTSLDPLYAARLTAVIVGGFQVVVTAATGYVIATKSQQRRRVALTAALLTVVLPFWYFHHRMALTDGMTTLWASSSLLLALIAVLYRHSDWHRAMLWAGVGFFLGLGILTKIPAILILPSLGLLPLLHLQTGWKDSKVKLFKEYLGLSMALAIAIGMFLLLKFTPVFGQLFSRGSDFLFPLQEILFEGKLLITLGRTPEYLTNIGSYMTWPVLALHLVGLFISRHRWMHHYLFWSSILVIAPIAVLGKIVYPRYFLLTAILITPHVALVLEDLVHSYIEQSSSFLKQAGMALLLSAIGGLIMTSAAAFIYPSIFEADTIPFTKEERTQYLTEWSSGHGIHEVVQLIQAEAEDKSIAVATEGYFGTLPDGLLLYLHQADTSNIYVEGIGQPVRSIPDFFVERAQNYEEAWLVVNEHRLDLDLPEEAMLARYCRPYEAPCLEVWDISSSLRNR